MANTDTALMDRAYKLALKSYNEGGCPIGAVLVDETGRILGHGHNKLVQEGNPVLHGEMTALRDAGRMESRNRCTLYTTLSPCMMCAGTILQFRIPRVVIGDTTNSPGNADFLRENDVQVDVLDHQPCIELVAKFREKSPGLWLEDWGGPSAQA